MKTFPEDYEEDYQQFIYCIIEWLVDNKDRDWVSSRKVNLETAGAQKQIDIFYRNVWCNKGCSEFRDLELFTNYLNWLKTDTGEAAGHSWKRNMGTKWITFTFCLRTTVACPGTKGTKSSDNWERAQNYALAKKWSEKRQQEFPIQPPQHDKILDAFRRKSENGST